MPARIEYTTSDGERREIVGWKAMAIILAVVVPLLFTVCYILSAVF